MYSRMQRAGWQTEGPIEAETTSSYCSVATQAGARCVLQGFCKREGLDPDERWEIELTPPASAAAIRGGRRWRISCCSLLFSLLSA